MNQTSSPGVTYLMITGIVMLIFGVVAIASPAVAGTAVVYVIGAVLLLTGIFEIIQGLREPGWSSKLLDMILGVITAVCGGAVLAHPILGLTTLTLVIGAFFVVEGIWKVVASFSFRPASGWIAMLFSGIMALVLAFLIFRDWPLSGLWAVGILVGVDLLSTGFSMIVLAMTLKGVKKALDEPAPE